MHLPVSFGVVFILEAVAHAMDGEPCTTPNGENATCISFADCPVIAEAVATFTPEAIKFGLDSTCGAEPGMVCCGTTGFLTFASIPEEERVILDPISDRTVCGLDALPSYRVKGGTVADFKEYPWLTALEYNSTYTNQTAGIRCGGSLVHKQYVLTAAHCIVHVEFMITRAWLGVSNIGPEGNCLTQAGEIECINSTVKIPVVKTIAHPHYDNFHGNNDIGLLQLQDRVTITEYIRLTCLPARNSPLPKIGTYFSVAGWGITENNTQSDIKLKVEVPLQNDSVCNKFLQFGKSAITAEQLCVGGERGKDTCEGDSGGPLMKSFTNENGKSQWYQEGLVSYGVGCGNEGRPAIYTRVSPYVEWMFDKIYDLGGPTFYHKNGETCETPTAKPGKCVPLNECQEVFNLAATKNSSARNSVQNYFCGYGKELLVCCESPGPAIVPNLETKALPGKTVCGLVKIEPSANGKAIAQPGEFPWVVGVEFKRDGTDIAIRCSGALISSRYVLTTGSCLQNNQEPVSVWLGDWNITKSSDCNKNGCAQPVRRVPVKQAIPHPLHTTFYYDVGLILLEDEVKFTDYITPICLTLSSFPSPKSGSHIIMAEWERKPNGTSPDVLRKYPLSLNEECSGRAFTVHGSSPYSNKLCWEYEVDDFTNNITGVPFMRPHEDEANGTVQWYLDGVTTVHFNSQSTILYTSVGSTLDWIINIISEG